MEGTDDFLYSSDEDDNNEEISEETEEQGGNDHDDVASDSSDVSDEEESEEENEEHEEGEELKELQKIEPVEISSEIDKNLTFSKIGVPSWLVERLDMLRITKPTPVQAACIPRINDGSDVLGCAKTGTGKTLSFALPILKKLAVDPFGIFALILTPTRELAFQIADQFTSLGRPICLKVSVIVGGKCIIQQATELSQRPHIVIATPGRLTDHLLNNESLSNVLKKVEFFVLDEADRLLDGQFTDDLKIIFDAVPKKRQTLLFSATISTAITTLHNLSVRKPFFFEDKSQVTTVEKLEQKFVLCPMAVKDAYLVYVVKNYLEQNSKSSVLVFAETCREAHALSYMFTALGFEVGVLHSQVSQKIRMASLSAFRSKNKKVLICTDVAARGLDIPHVDLVINHNIPRCPKTYVHRVGRSARAGRYGSALIFCTQHDIVLLQACEEYVGKKFDELKVNHKQVTKYTTKVLVSKKEAHLKLESEQFGEKRENQKKLELMMAGMTEEEAEEFLAAKRNKQERPTKKRSSNHEQHIDSKKQKKSILDNEQSVVNSKPGRKNIKTKKASKA